MMDLAGKMLNVNNEDKKDSNPGTELFNLTDYRSEVNKLNENNNNNYEMEDDNDEKSSKKSGKSPKK